MTRGLKNLAALLDKASVHAGTKKFDSAVLAQSRLYPDMFPLVRQVQIACDTVKGAAEMLLQSGKHPGVLKDSVCSPGGTTIEAVAALEEGGMRSAVIKAVVAAADRSRVLGGGGPKL